MRKPWSRTLCILLVAILIFNMLPLNALAIDNSSIVEVGEDPTMQETIPVIDSTDIEQIYEEKPAYVVEEDVSKRSEFYKEFILSNGLRLATIYPDAVHYEDNGQWKEIDNTLTAKIVDGQSVYTNTSGLWDVRFPQRLNASNSIAITKDGYTVSFGMAGEMRSSGDLVVASMVNELETNASTVLPITGGTIDSIAQVQSIDTTTAKAAAEFAEIIPDKLHSRLLYPSVYNNTNIVYDLQSNQVKESIILQSFDSELMGYRYALNTGGLIPALNDDQSINLCDPDSNDIVMTMPAPFMLDANDEYCEDITVSLVQRGNSYILSYHLPVEWLGAEDRAWPIILDPVISANNATNNIQDITVAENGTESNTAARVKCGYHPTLGICRFYLRFKTLPSLTSSMVIVKANIALTKDTSSSLSAPIEVHKVDAPWEASQTNWSNKPNYQSNIEDVVTVEDGGEYTWDITDIAFGWYSDTQNALSNNTGMLFKAANDVETAQVNNWQQLCSSDHTLTRPVLTITYIDTNGLESYWDTTSSSAGRAGTGYIQPYSGNLTWVHDDIGFDGNLMPVSISHIYNSSDASDGTNLFGMGIGWRTNYNQRVYVKDDGYEWEDGDGTKHFFTHSAQSGIYYNTDDHGISLEIKSSQYIIKDKYNNRSIFDSSGRLIRQENYQATTSSIKISYDATYPNRITDILDGANRKYEFEYDDGLLKTIKYYGTGSSIVSSISFDYTNVNLTTIIYADSKQSTFSYTSKNLLTTATDIDGYKILYSYNTVTAGMPSRIVSSVESDKGVAGRSITFSYKHNQTVLTDHNGLTQTLFFNDYGNTTSIQDSEGLANFYQYATDISTSGAKNRIVKVSQQQNTIINALKDTSFENGTEWDAPSSAVTVSISDDIHYIGNKSLRLSPYAPGSAGASSGPHYVSSGESVTFSAYLYSGGSASIRISDDQSNTVTSSPLDEASKWNRLEVTYTNTTTSTRTLTLEVYLMSSSTVYVDCVQLEKGERANRYNMVTDSDISLGMGTGRDWYPYSNGTKKPSCSAGQPASVLTGNRIYINGDTNTAQYVAQNILTSGEADDRFVFTGWVSGTALSSGPSNRFCGLKLIFAYTDGSESDPYLLPLKTHLKAPQEWQYLAGEAIAEKAYSSVRIVAEHSYNANVVYFDGLQLFKEELGETYTYTPIGNVTMVRDATGLETKYSYNALNDCTLVEYPTRTAISNTYDEYHNLVAATQMYDKVSGENTSYEVIDITTHTYDQYGNLLSTKVESKDGDITKETSAEYENNGNTLKSSTDASGNETSYSYDANTGLLKSVQEPASSRIYYDYDPKTFQLKETYIYTNGVKEPIKYTYDDDLLETIQTPSTTYTISYDYFALQSSIVAGGNTLATYHYTDYQNRYLSRLDFGNNDRVIYSYDGLGRVTREIRYKEGGGTYRVVNYTYDANGTLATVSDTTNGITTKYYYDDVGRNSGFKETTSINTHRVNYIYDKYGRVEKISESYKYNSTDQSESSIANYEYDNLRNNLSSVTFNNGTKETYTYDKVDRIEQKTAQHNGTTVFTEKITYSSTNDRVATLDLGNLGTYQYVYDANGNITRILNGGKTTRYTYDSKNQLIREDNPHAGKTWIWTYDAGGNITSKKEYAYTTSQSPTQVYSSFNYYYGNSSWGDLLTNYNGKTITYDAIGNPLDYGDQESKWEWGQGRQLVRMNDGSSNWYFYYDSNGVRYQRLSGSNVYTYVYNGSQLSRMTYRSNTMWFTYGADGSPLTITYNGTTYYYVTNLQGDVVAILNSSGTAVVSYTYDAWGKILSTTGTMASTLGLHNPLRYRGYVYDRETGLYYLQSRYYNPEWGRFINADNYPSTGQGLLGNNMFAYCGNNPVAREDGGGEFWNIVIGATVGALISAATTAIDSYATTGSIDWAAVGISAAVGAISGGVAATGLGVIAQASISAAASALGSVATDIHELSQNPNSDGITWSDVGQISLRAIGSAAIGFGGSVFGTAAGKAVTSGLEAQGANMVFRGKIGAGCMTKAQARNMVKQGKALINTARGVSSVVGSVFVWPTATAFSFGLS